MFKFDKGFVPCILGSLLLFLLSGCGEDSVETSGSGSNTSVVGDSAASGTQNDADTLSIVKDIRLSKGPSSVLLDWDAVDGATSYHVYYSITRANRASSPTVTPAKSMALGCKMCSHQFASAT